MTTAYITHSDCLKHDTGIGHPECAARIHAIEDRLFASQLYGFLLHRDAPLATREQLLRVHKPEHIDGIESEIPHEGKTWLDPDTPVSPDSFVAAHHAAGGVIEAVDMVMNGDAHNAFCAVRPPGHHAESDGVMGFCMFNNIAVGAAHAMEEYGLKRVAILDFDVHHGNGTEEIFLNDERVMFGSTFQHPLYPESPFTEGNPRLLNVPLPRTTRGEGFREAVENFWLPQLDAFKPELVMISAGFDAHQADDISSIGLTDRDYAWVTSKLLEVADKHAGGKLVSSLEGGYELHSLARSVEAHLREMMGLG